MNYLKIASAIVFASCLVLFVCLLISFPVYLACVLWDSLLGWL